MMLFLMSLLQLRLRFGHALNVLTEPYIAILLYVADYDGALWQCTFVGHIKAKG